MLSAVKMAFKALLANKIRSFLTLIGIVLGVAAIIVVRCTSEGIKKDIKKRFEDLGANIVSVYPNYQNQAVAPVPLEMGDLPAIRQKCPSVRRASGSLSDNSQIKYRNASSKTDLVGADMEYLIVRRFELEAGRYFTQAEIDGMRKLAVIGGKTRDALFKEGDDPIGAEVKVGDVLFKIIGVLKSKGDYQFDITIIPLSTAQYRIMGKRTVNRIDVEATAQETTATAKQEIVDLLAARRGEKPDDYKTFEVWDSGEMLKQAGKQQQTIAVFLAIIGGISLLIGGVGIMNIMLISVTERTREIGVRKAIGARQSDILMQFLIESVFLCLLGGGLGILLAYYLNGYISTLETFPQLEMTADSVVLAVGVSAGVGVLFGIWPAWTASRKAPVEALRYE